MKRFAWTFALILLAAHVSWAAPGRKALPASPPPPARVVAPASAESPEGFKQIQDIILKSLEDGNDVYKKQDMPALKASGRWARLLKGHSPKAMVLACSDARVVPETIFHAGPGELYVVRVAGPTVSPEILASLEYGADKLRIPVLVVLGHVDCGAARSALEAQERVLDTRESDNQRALYDRLAPACSLARASGLKGAALEDAVVKYNVKNTLRAMLEQSPLLWNLVKKKGQLRTVGAVYGLQTGEVYWIP
jgi:carbonic anhydrase